LCWAAFTPFALRLLTPFVNFGRRVARSSDFEAWAFLSRNQACSSLTPLVSLGGFKGPIRSADCVAQALLVRSDSSLRKEIALVARTNP